MKQIQYQGETFIYLDIPRKDVRLVGLLPVSNTVVKVLTVFNNDEVIVRKQQTTPKLVRSLLSQREAVLR